MRLHAVCFLVLASVALPSPAVSGAKILCMFGFSSKSHNHVFSALTAELARRGHALTVVTPYAIKNPPGKYRQIDVPQIRTVIESMDANNIQSKNVSITQMIKTTWMFSGICSNILELPEVNQLLNEKFDLVINSVIFNECTLGFAHHNKAPLILISPSGSLLWSITTMGNPEPASYVPNIGLPFSDQMSFKQRAINALVINFVHVVRCLVHLPRMNAAARDFFGEDTPSISELEHSASLAFLNNHVSLNYPRPLLPNVVEVGGMHVVNQTKPLPKDIQEFLDGAKEGVIYFSLGSLIRSDHLAPEKLKAFLDAFSELPQRVLWKWESDTLPGQPANVKLGKWLPQQDILAHPKVRLFITQGGLMSTQEAAYHGVPLLGLPVLGDQALNMQRSERLGFAVSMDLETLDKASLLLTIDKVLHTPSYKETAKRLMRIVRDQPQSPLERGVFWTEYVLRHQGAPHLRSAATRLAWYQLHQLDVAAAIFAGLLLLVLALRGALSMCRGGAKSSPNLPRFQKVNENKDKMKRP